MYYDREFLNSTKFEASTTDAIVSPVTETELSDWLELGDPTNSLLPILLRGATEQVTRYIDRNLINRNYVAVWWDFPTYGTLTRPSLGGQVGDFKNEFVLPYAGLQSVTSVEIFGQAITDFVERTESVIINDNGLAFVNPDSTAPAVKIEYVAGYGATADAVPDDIKQAILQTAAYQYEHRGACAMGESLMQSGAKELLSSYRKGAQLV